MSDDTTNWTELREFRHVDLEESYVLSWKTEGESLLIDVDLNLRPEHAFYERPRPAEKACFRAAYIELPWCSRIALQGDSKARSVAGSINGLGLGKIHGFRRTGEGQYEISGDFGVIDILAERPMVRLKDQRT